MRSWRAVHDLIAMSFLLQETGLNVEQTLDRCMLMDMGNIPDVTPRRESNEDEANGVEGVTAIYDLGGTSGLPVSNKRGQPQHFAAMIGYGLGSVSTAAAGAGYEHTILPIADDVDESRSVPTFTVGARLGNTVMKRRLASMAVDSFTAKFPKDDWCQISGQLKGTGKYTDSVTEETVSALGNATTLTLAANGVHGATDQARLDNVQRIRVELTSGQWTEVEYTAVSSATPAVITFTSPGGAATAVNYKVLYLPVESGWMTFPARVEESPLRVSQMTLKVGGAWTGSAFVGGRTLSAEVNSLEWKYQNNLAVTFGPGAGGVYANRIFRPARTHTIALDRELRNYILQQHIADNDAFGVYVLAEGEAIDGSHNYQVELIFPSVSVLKAPIKVDGKVLAEAGELQPLVDSTYGDVICKIKNLAATLAA